MDVRRSIYPSGVAAALLFLGACSGAASPATSNIVASTSAPIPAPLLASSVTPASSSTTPSPSGTTVAAPAACPGTSVSRPTVVALRPTTRRLCWSWSEPSNTNFYPLGLDGPRLIGIEQSCDEGNGGLVALDAVTGTRLWRDSVATDSLLVTVDSGLVLSLDGANQRLTGINSSTGKTLWTFARAVDTAVQAPHLVAAGTSNGTASRVTVLDPATGKQLWTIDVGEKDNELVADDDAVLVTGPKVTTGYDAATGARLWSAPFGNASDTDAPRITEGVASGSSMKALGVGYDVKSGKLLWTNPASPTQEPDPLDGNVFVQTEGSSVVQALDARTGDVRWKVTRPGQDQTAGVTPGPGIVVVTGDIPFTAGETKGLEPVTGAVRWSVGKVAGLPVASRYVDLIPTTDLVYLTYGDCLGGDCCTRPGRWCLSRCMLRKDEDPMR